MSHTKTLAALPAFSDNYIWLLPRSGEAVVVDPGDAAVVEKALQKQGLHLRAILVTHHHADHIGGVAELHQRHGAIVYGPAREEMPVPIEPMMQGVTFELLGCQWETLDVPGHTSGHVAYVCREANETPLLFCGDTLFAAGCGRVFEGTPAQMLASLDALSALPSDSLVCCAHEYTLSNLRFALAVEPHNKDLQVFAQHCQTLRDQGQPTVPTRLDSERRINPFLRVREGSVRESVSQQAQWRDAENQNDVAVFAALREWKNNFK